MLSLFTGYMIGWGIYGVYYGDVQNISDCGKNFMLGILSGFIVPIGALELLYNKYIEKNE
jgi:hypothetical protein